MTRGLYSKLRHPVYIFGSLSWFGTVMDLVGWQAAVIWLVVVPIQIVRAARGAPARRDVRHPVRGVPREHVVLSASARRAVAVS